jgi:Uncharacterized conserved protein
MTAARKFTDIRRMLKHTAREVMALLAQSTEDPSHASRPAARDRPHVHILDTAIASDNIGDEIIMKSAYGYIKSTFEDYYITSSSSHDGIGPSSRKLIHRADIVLLVGTNALSARYHANKPYIWHMRSSDIELLRGKVVLFGVGANKAFHTVEKSQAGFLDEILSKSHLHAVRDSSGKRILEAIGRKVVDATCPTLWMFQGKMPAHPAGKAEKVCFTLTKHKPSNKDHELITMLRENYKELYFWPQQPRDLPYLQSLTQSDDIEIIAPNLRSYDNFLVSTHVDVIGTRLHGTIRALQQNKRAIVIGIDNRAHDIAIKTNLCCVSREEIAVKLPDLLQSELTPKLTIPTADIDAFLRQFKLPEPSAHQSARKI